MGTPHSHTDPSNGSSRDAAPSSSTAAATIANVVVHQPPSNNVTNNEHPHTAKSTSPVPRLLPTPKPSETSANSEVGTNPGTLSSAEQQKQSQKSQKSQHQQPDPQTQPQKLITDQRVTEKPETSTTTPKKQQATPAPTPVPAQTPAQTPAPTIAPGSLAAQSLAGYGLLKRSRVYKKSKNGQKTTKKKVQAGANNVGTMHATQPVTHQQVPPIQKSPHPNPYQPTVQILAPVVMANSAFEGNVVTNFPAQHLQQLLFHQVQGSSTDRDALKRLENQRLQSTQQVPQQSINQMMAPQQGAPPPLQNIIHQPQPQNLQHHQHQHQLSVQTLPIQQHHINVSNGYSQQPQHQVHQHLQLQQPQHPQQPSLAHLQRQPQLTHQGPVIPPNFHTAPSTQQHIIPVNVQNTVNESAVIPPPRNVTPTVLSSQSKSTAAPSPAPVSQLATTGIIRTPSPTATATPTPTPVPQSQAPVKHLVASPVTEGQPQVQQSASKPDSGLLISSATSKTESQTEPVSVNNHANDTEDEIHPHGKANDQAVTSKKDKEISELTQKLESTQSKLQATLATVAKLEADREQFELNVSYSMKSLQLQLPSLAAQLTKYKTAYTEHQRALDLKNMLLKSYQQELKENATSIQNLQTNNSQLSQTNLKITELLENMRTKTRDYINSILEKHADEYNKKISELKEAHTRELEARSMGKLVKDGDDERAGTLIVAESETKTETVAVSDAAVSELQASYNKLFQDRIKLRDELNEYLDENQKLRQENETLDRRLKLFVDLQKKETKEITEKLSTLNPTSNSEDQPAENGNSGMELEELRKEITDLKSKNQQILRREISLLKKNRENKDRISKLKKQVRDSRRRRRQIGSIMDDNRNMKRRSS